MAVESLYRAVLGLPQAPAVVQFVGLMPRSPLSEEYGGGTSGGALAQFLPQMNKVGGERRRTQGRGRGEGGVGWGGGRVRDRLPLASMHKKGQLLAVV